MAGDFERTGKVTPILGLLGTTTAFFDSSWCVYNFVHAKGSFFLRYWDLDLSFFLGAGDYTAFFWELRLSRLSLDVSWGLLTLNDLFLVLDILRFFDWEVSCMLSDTLLKHFSLFYRLFFANNFYFDPFLCLLILGGFALIGFLKKLTTV